MKTIPLTELSNHNIQVQDLQVFAENWTNHYNYTRYKNAPRSCSGLFIICTDIHATFYEKGGNTVKAGKGDVVFLPKGVHYHAEILDGRNDLIDTYTLNFHLREENGEEFLLCDRISILVNRQDDLFAIRTAAVSSAFHQAAPRNHLRLTAAVYHLLDAIAAAAEEQSSIYYPIRIGTEALRAEWNQNRKIEEYAALCGVGSAYFYRCFRGWSGKSPVQYRNEIRLSNAETMLRHTDIQIHEIARTVGFSDAFYFCRLFTKAYGLPPRKYRAAFRTQEGE